MDRPAIGSIDLYRTKNGIVTVGQHSVVIYGYQTILYNGQNIDGFIAHFGWENDVNGKDYTNIWFNADWIYNYLSFVTTHVHNNITTINAAKHMYECGECGGAFLEVTHDKVAYRMLDTSSPLYYTKHTVICSCGHEYQDSHEYRYIIKNSEHHIKTCVCGYERDESHYFKYDECYDCQYIP